MADISKKRASRGRGVVTKACVSKCNRLWIQYIFENIKYFIFSMERGKARPLNM